MKVRLTCAARSVQTIFTVPDADLNILIELFEKRQIRSAVRREIASFIPNKAKITKI